MFSILHLLYLMKGKRPIQCWVAMLKIWEKYEELAAGLQDIIAEAKNSEAVNVDDKVYNIGFYLEGDLEFLAIFCSCIWWIPLLPKVTDLQELWSEFFSIMINQ